MITGSRQDRHEWPGQLFPAILNSSNGNQVVLHAHGLAALASHPRPAGTVNGLGACTESICMAECIAWQGAQRQAEDSLFIAVNPFDQWELASSETPVHWCTGVSSLSANGASLQCTCIMVLFVVMLI